MVQLPLWKFSPGNYKLNILSQRYGTPCFAQCLFQSGIIYQAETPWAYSNPNATIFQRGKPPSEGSEHNADMPCGQISCLNADQHFTQNTATPETVIASINCKTKQRLFIKYFSVSLKFLGGNSAIFVGNEKRVTVCYCNEAKHFLLSKSLESTSMLLRCHHVVYEASWTTFLCAEFFTFD